MKIYHGTHTGVLASILGDGISPRGNRHGNWLGAPSHADYVYLTSAYPIYFALFSVPVKSSNKPVIIEIDMRKLDESLLAPDEDFIAQVLWKYKIRGEKLESAELNRARTLRGMAKRIIPSDYQDCWWESLERLGQVAYHGIVSPMNISRCAIIAPEAAPLLVTAAMQPTISIDNYAHCSQHYESLVRFLFDGTDIADEFADSEASCTLEYVSAMLEGQEKMREQRRTGVRVMTDGSFPAPTE